MKETAKKLNRAGHSHSGKIRLPYSFTRLTTMRNGRERKLSATQLTALAAISSYSEGENVAKFTHRTMSENYHFSKSSAERAIKTALKAGIVKRLEKLYEYKYEGDKSFDGFLFIEEWAYHAELDFNNGIKDFLSHNEVRVLFYIKSWCDQVQKGPKLWEASCSHIARRLNIAPNTVIAAIKRLKAAGLLYTHGRASNGYTRTMFMISYKALKMAKSATIRRAKKLSSEIQSANARTDFDRYYSVLHAMAEEPAEKARAKARADETYRNAEKELRELDAQIARAEYEKSDTIREILLKRRHAAEKQRAERLAAMGLTQEDLLPRYHCPKCSDTGFLPNGRMCDCYPRRRRP